jgi:hypothetical protein
MQNVVAEKSFARAKFVADDKRIENLVSSTRRAGSLAIA